WDDSRLLSALAKLDLRLSQRRWEPHLHAKALGCGFRAPADRFAWAMSRSSSAQPLRQERKESLLRLYGFWLISIPQGRASRPSSYGDIICCFHRVVAVSSYYPFII